jgi:hypothetical protein
MIRHVRCISDTVVWNASISLQDFRTNETVYVFASFHQVHCTGARTSFLGSSLVYMERRRILVLLSFGPAYPASGILDTTL